MLISVKNKKNHKRKSVLGMIVFGCFLMTIQGFAQDFQNDLRMARSYMRQARWEDARRILEPVQQRYPDVQILFVELKQIYIQMNDLDAALSLSKTYLKNHPNDPTAKTEYAEALYRNGKTGEAMKTWGEVIDTSPKDQMSYHLVCNAMQNVQLYQEAAGVYLRGRMEIGQEELFALNLANVYKSAEKYGKATEELLLYLSVFPKQMSVVLSTIERFPRSERIDKEVTDAIRKVIKQHPGHEGYLRVLSWQLLRQKDYDGALEVMLALDLKKSGKEQGANLLFLAQEAAQQKQFETAGKAYQSILENFPNLSFKDRIYFGWAQAEMSIGQFQQAVHHYEEAIRSSSDAQLIDESRFQRAVLLRDSLSLVPEALRGFTECYDNSRDPDVREKALIAMGECEIILSRTNDAEAHWQKVYQSRSKKRDAIWLEAMYDLSELNAMQGDFKACLDQLSELKGYRSSGEGFSLDRMNDALGLRLLIQSHMKKDSTALRLFMHSRLLDKQWKWMEAISTLEEINQNFPKSGLADDALLFQSEIYREIKQPEQSLVCLGTLLARYPKSTLAEKAVFESAILLESMKKEQEAQTYYERLLIEYPGGMYSRQAREKIRSAEQGAIR